MDSKPGLILQHGPAGPPDILGEWLEERGIPYEVHHAWEAPPPPVEGRAFLASLGSPSSAVNGAPAWVAGELDAMRRAVAADVPVLGLCFGGQTLALALGGGLEPAPEPEIGWLSVESEDDSVPPGPWAQYHYEIIRLPPGARELARTPAGPAAFRIGPHTGTQFHPEVTPERMSIWARMAELPPGITPELIDEQGARHGAAAREQAWRLFDGWWASR
ncbi:MAG TPA: type 1 glutamine amidotransferase [Thermoleophilaceae bacterium]